MAPEPNFSPAKAPYRPTNVEHLLDTRDENPLEKSDGLCNAVDTQDPTSNSENEPVQFEQEGAVSLGAREQCPETGKDGTREIIACLPFNSTI